MVAINLRVSAAIYIFANGYYQLTVMTPCLNTRSISICCSAQRRISNDWYQFTVYSIFQQRVIPTYGRPQTCICKRALQNLQCTSSSNTECSCRRVAWRWSILLEHWPEAGRLHYSSIPDKRRCFQFAIIRGNTLANCCYWVAFSICNLFAVLTSTCNAVHMLVQCISWLLLANGCY